MVMSESPLYDKGYLTHHCGTTGSGYVMVYSMVRFAFVIRCVMSVVYNNEIEQANAKTAQVLNAGNIYLPHQPTNKHSSSTNREILQPTTSAFQSYNTLMTMADRSHLLNPLEWEGNTFDRTPVWPHEPDVAVIKTIAKQHLAPLFSDSLEDALLEVTFHAEGAFNRLYEITYGGHETTYMFRATLPVIPFFKTESEVATMAFLRAKTSVPAPRVFAWDSSAKNELGFEWILMEKVGGVELGEVWRKVPWERKLTLVEEIAGFMQQLRNNAFESVGALYFKRALAIPRDGKGDPLIGNEVGEILPDDTNGGVQSLLNRPTEETTDEDQQARVHDRNAASVVGPQHNEDEFAVGPMFSTVFFMGCRLYLPGDRGPYANCTEWLKAVIDMQITLAKTGRPEGDPDYDSHQDEDFPDILEACQQLLEIMPAIFPYDEDKVSTTLHCSDLNDANILVDPETFEILGIVDWECVNIMPHWRTCDYPEFLKYTEFYGGKEPPVPDYDIEDDPMDTIEIRDRWDYGLLRDHYNEATERLSSGSSYPVVQKSAKLKQEFYELLIEVDANASSASYWVKRHEATGGILENSDDPGSDEDELDTESHRDNETASYEDRSEQNSVPVQIESLALESGSTMSEPKAESSVNVSGPEKSSITKTEPNELTEEQEEAHAPVPEHTDAEADYQKEDQKPGIIHKAVTAITNSFQDVAAGLCKKPRTQDVSS